MGNKKIKAEKLNDAVRIDIPMTRQHGWEQRFLLVSDVHCDNKGFKRSLFKKHMDEALKIGAPVIDNGDFFDCMGGKWDKRSSKSDILPELQDGKYFDLVVKYGAELLAPYKDNILIMSEGNHEISVRDRHETDLTERVIQSVNPSILHQKYTGWVIFRFLGNNAMYTTTMYRTHGNGGNAPVTKGVIQSARRQDIIDADIYIAGHIHTEYYVPRPKWTLDRNGNIKIKTPIHQQIGTYKDSTMKTWEDMKGFAPPSLGGQWLIFSYDGNENQIKYRFQPCL
jgi:hypothetical protein